MGMDLQKYKKCGVSKIINHYDRYDGKVVKYKNRDIDTSLSYLNYNLLGITAKQARERLYQRVKKVDEDWVNSGGRHVTRKDRVIMVGCVIDCPKVLVGTGREDEFFKLAYEWECKAFGKENIIDCSVHKDEVHDYIDNRTDEWTTSRWHMHSAIVPVVVDKKKEIEKICGKEFMDKGRMTVFHKELDKFIFERMGIHTLGDEPWTAKSIEMDELKQNSRAKARQEHELAQKLNIPVEQPKPIPLESRKGFMLPKDEAIYKRADVDSLVDENAELRTLIASNKHISDTLMKQAQEAHQSEYNRISKIAEEANQQIKAANQLLSACKKVFEEEDFSEDEIQMVLNSKGRMELENSLSKVKRSKAPSLLESYKTAVKELSWELGLDIESVASEYHLYDLMKSLSKKTEYSR